MAITVREHINAAIEAGFQGPALELITHAGATFRHKSRVDDTLEAALEAAGNRCELTAAFMIAIDLGGIGGALGLSGESTVRAPMFQGLGKGRWQASDGAAYRAAAEEALCRLRRGRELMARADASGVGVFWAQEGGVAFFGWEWFRARGICPWIRAEIGRAVLWAYRNTDPAPVVVIPGVFDSRVKRPQVLYFPAGFIRWDSTPRQLSAAWAAANNAPVIVCGCISLETTTGRLTVDLGDHRVEVWPGEEYPDEEPVIDRLLEGDGQEALAALGIVLIDGDEPGTSQLRFV
jgi:hypothetical protein